MMNSGVSERSEFRVAVANPNAASVTVTLFQGEAVVSTTEVSAGDVVAIAAPWVPALRQRIRLDPFDRLSASVADGAYRLESTLPIAAYQFSPYEFELDGTSSHSNDASLLLPTATLGTEYFVHAWPTYRFDDTVVAGDHPGVYTIVATRDGTEVTVRSSAHTLAGPTGDPAPLSPGEERTFRLDAADVLQIASARGAEYARCVTNALRNESCVSGPDGDVTGTWIRASEPIAVFGGHSCAFVPFMVAACDHLESQLLPLETWGRSLVAVSTPPLVDHEPSVFRVMSGTDGNRVRFEPQVHPPITLDAGEYVQIEHHGAFRVEGTGRVSASQFAVGQDFQVTLDDRKREGDPGMTIAVPVEQYRADYRILVPATYPQNWITLVARAGTTVYVDGEAVTGFTPIEGTDLGFLHRPIAPGAHHLESRDPSIRFGLQVYGVASYASYLFPGGLDLALVELI
jgi:hypothetical protein